MKPHPLLLAAAALLLLTSCETIDSTLYPAEPPSINATSLIPVTGSQTRETLVWNGFRIQASSVSADMAVGAVRVRFPSHFSLRTATADWARLSRTDKGVPALVLSGSPRLDGQRGKLDLVTGGPATSITVTSDARYQVTGPATYGSGTL